jgi:outer membrane protein OmpA-like peptidoglycan-associated protein
MFPLACRFWGGIITAENKPTKGRAVRKIRPLIFLAAIGIGAASPLSAAPDLVLKFAEGAEQTGQSTEENTSFQFATGPFKAGELPTISTEGPLRQLAWRVTMDKVSTLELLQSLRTQIRAAGYDVLFDCETEACGGFDFRFQVKLLPEPTMHVDLGDFRYLAAKRQGASGMEYLSLMISRSPQDGFVQLTQSGGALASPLQITTQKPAEAAPDTAPPAQGTIAAQLSLGLPIVLEDLEFKSSSGELNDEDYASLRALADWLKANPSEAVVLVGHTDASGSLAGNVALSKLRAANVRARLLGKFGVAARQVTSDGVGPLAPRTQDRTPEGRNRNRRVEVVLTTAP